MTMSLFRPAAHGAAGDPFSKFERHMTFTVGPAVRHGAAFAVEDARRVWAELRQVGRREQFEFGDFAVHVAQRLSGVESQVADLRVEMRTHVGELRMELAEVKSLLASRPARGQRALRSLLERLPVPDVGTEPLSDDVLDLIFEARRREE